MAQADKQSDAPSTSSDNALRELVRLLARQAARDARCGRIDSDLADAQPTDTPEFS